MIKKLFAVVIVAGLLGCEKKQETINGCAPKECTLSFAMIGVQFKDKNGNALVIKNLSSINQRTKESVLPSTQPGVNQPGYYNIADDGVKSKLSTDGDDVLVSATNPANDQTKSATFKISGGCNCHIEKITGPATINFD